MNTGKIIDHLTKEVLAGSSKSQTRNPDAVLNHLHFCMMATSLTWVYADKLQFSPRT